jgi:hypothetical protein
MFKLASLSPKEIFQADLQNEPQHSPAATLHRLPKQSGSAVFGQLFCKIRRKAKVIPFQHCLSHYFFCN